MKLTGPSFRYTMCHMKTISIRELHEKTGEWIRRAGKHGEIFVTDRGRTVAKILPETGPKNTPYFSRRTFSPAFRRLMGRVALSLGTDSTKTISESRDRPIS
jgi:antitoxin (DNA-binding transcriptional repressor) of toxin-antitoxin stability system